MFLYYHHHFIIFFQDPIAPTYVIVGRPGNAEDIEKLLEIPQSQRIKELSLSGIHKLL
jgi:hypothetical protein